MGFQENQTYDKIFLIFDNDSNRLFNYFRYYKIKFDHFHHIDYENECEIYKNFLISSSIQSKSQT